MRLKHHINGIKFIFSDFVQNYLASGVCCPRFLRVILYRLSGNRVGKGCYLSPRCFLGPGRGNLFVGRGTFINYNCWFDLGDDIIIGENVNIAMNVQFINGTHEIGDSKRRAGKGISNKVIVGNGAWIGASSMIMPGVTIGEGTIIGAGSLVISNCEPNSIYVGRPAKLLRKID